MSEEKVHLRHCMSFKFQKGNNPMEANRGLCDVFEEEAVTTRTCQRWLAKFCLGDFSFKDESISGKPSGESNEVLHKKIRTNPTLTSTETGLKLGIYQNTALDFITCPNCLFGCHTNQQKKVQWTEY
ncbi:histone-lysine N-methyltransferase SETMAR [Trichonephila clavipes]|nr:histone-lysine N-methyltransferase SETMAR [Trichonephila clavipes]